MLVAILIFATTFPASASKLQGTSILKDSQPIGSIDKEHKHQTYDLTFQASGREYTCQIHSLAIARNRMRLDTIPIAE
jgi:hypothetical protein